MSEALGLLRRLESQLHAALAEGSEVHEVDAFRAHVWRTPDPFYRNVAVPVRPKTEWAAAIEALRRLFARYERRSRVEFFAELWPGLDRALEAAGFLAESRAPVMTACGGSLPPAKFAPRIELLDGDTPEGTLRAYLEGAAAAFHEPTAMLAPGELERLQQGLARGTLRTAVVLDAGTPVAGASLAGGGPVAELLGVWTSVAYRRRGFARILCRRLLGEFFAAAGEIVWPTAGSKESLGLYGGLGFAPCGTHLDYADQAETA
jgi:ribosomal protein S18 acetylase RimI-like enzyme